jgi:hypothetical protein
LRFLHANQAAIQQKTLGAMLDELPKLAQIHDFIDRDDTLFPTTTDIWVLRKYLGLSAIHLMENEKEGFAYAGYQFRCTWDQEHGLGIMTHMDRIIEISEADSSFAWVHDPEK